MRVITPPEIYTIEARRYGDGGRGTGPTLFLAGGISRCPDWQQEMIRLLGAAPTPEGFTIFNPRRLDFPIGNPEAAREQIHWEYYHLLIADLISFWFPKESICPIALYELGRWAALMKRIFVGADPEYPRRLDIEVQLDLARPGLRIQRSLDELVGCIHAHLRTTYGL